MRVGVVAALVAAWGATLPAQVWAQDSAQSVRQFEQVSPADKGGALLAVGSNLGQTGAAKLRPALAVADDGAGVTYATLGSMLPSLAGEPPTALGVAQLYAFRRGAAGGWTYRPTLPSDDLVFDSSGSARDQTLAVSGDLSRSVAVTYHGLTPATFQAQNNQPNLALVDSDNNATVITSPDPAALPFGVDYGGPLFLGASPALDTVYFGAAAALDVAPGDPAVPAGGTSTRLYAYHGGALHPVSVETDGATAFPNGGQVTPLQPGLVAADGSRVFFAASAGAAPNQLFARDLAPTPATRPVSVSKRTTADPACTLTANPGGAAATAPATFQGATPSGTVVLFTSRCELTDASTTGSADNTSSLYAYNLATGTLTDLSIDTTDATGANVAGVVGYADDASYVYFVARGKLDGTAAVTGQNNLYVWHGGSVKLLGALASGDSSAWTPAAAQYQRAQVSADGRSLLLLSAAALTSYASGGTAEVYALSSDGGAATCLSCAPSGGAPAGAATLAGGSLGADGARAVFTTPEALVPDDANAVADVYEVVGGVTRLVTSGASSSQGSALVGVGPDGDDVFFTTYDQLVPQDADDAPDLYDARVGGAEAPALASRVPACASALDGSCQGTPSGLPPVATGSVATDGRNATPAPAPVAPTVTLAKPTKAALKTMARTGRLRIVVRATGAVTLTAKATAKPGGKSATVAHASKKLAKAGSATLSMTLSKNARAALRRAGHLTVKVAVAGGRRTVTATLKLEVKR